MQAIVIGATGLVGESLVRQLSEDVQFTVIQLFVRRPVEKPLPKCIVHVVDFTAPESWKELVKGDVLFSCLGTTLKKAGSKQAQFSIDYSFQYSFARMASLNKVDTYVLVSAVGASERSLFFYSKMKGELERDIKKLGFSKIRIMQPGILEGDRKENRPIEKIAIPMMQVLSKIPGLHQYKPIHCTIVAKAMINSVSDSDKPLKTYKLNEVFRLAAGGS
jgi:uncharacterized protein YbjT (DUF2867 family)